MRALGASSVQHVTAAHPLERRSSIPATAKICLFFWLETASDRQISGVAEALHGLSRGADRILDRCSRATRSPRRVATGATCQRLRENVGKSAV